MMSPLFRCNVIRRAALKNLATKRALGFNSVKLVLSFFAFFLPAAAQAAACCGGGFAAPSLISGDDKAQISSTYAFSRVVVDNVDSAGIWRKWDQHQQVQIFRIEGAHLLSDRWQSGFSLPLMQRSGFGKTYSGWSDISASLGYEYLPDWDYNPIRPKGIGYLQITIPTGKARAESENGGMDSRGNGFWALGLGSLLSKVLGDWDLFTSLEIHRSFNKKVNNSQVKGTLKPGLGGSVGWGGGYNLRSWRFGVGLSWVYESPVRISANVNSPGAIERYATGTLSASYLASEAWSGTLSYSDQTLFGSPINTSLGRSVALQLMRKWGR